MRREQFIKTILKGATAITTLSASRSFTSGLTDQEQAMPVLFVGHGSPMNGIEEFDVSTSAESFQNFVPTALKVSQFTSKDSYVH